MSPELPLVIDCQTCVARLTDACADCVVTFLCDTAEDQPVVIEASEARVLHLMHTAGLVPGVRHRQARSA